ncbi:MAG: aminoglycoside phosphotransferase, partial [Chloroflexota bacterium]
IGTDDVAYMIALHGYRDWRRRYERRLLERYHEALLRSGVRGYTWASCWNDYRLSVLGSLFTPPHFWSINVPAYIWWAKLECGMQAFEDLGCAELLADLADD